MSSQQPVQTGFWTNWAEGQVLGTTLTLSARNGAYLVALLALFVRLVGGQLWLIISFVLFRIRSSPSAHDGFFLQQQAVLRNSTSDSAALFQFMRSIWYWHGETRSPLSRSLRLASLTALHIVIFAVAGAFSSRVTVTDSQVLLAPSDCGAWSFLSPQTDDTASYSFEHDNLARASKLASKCYNGTQIFSSAECLLSGRRLIPWTFSRNATCPFDASICAGNEVVTLDSGYVDSLYDLGINSRPENRISYRQVSTCTPLDIRKYITGFQQADTSLLGSDYRKDASLVWQSLLLGRNWLTSGNATFSFSNATINPDARVLGSVGESQAYIIDVEEYHSPDADSHFNSSFQPIPELQGNDTAVINLFILINNAGYTESVNDPWFNATRRQNDLFSSEQIFQVLGCSSEYFICQPQRSKSPICGRLTDVSAPLPNVQIGNHNISFNAVQTSMLARFTTATSRNAISRVPQFLGGDSLLASSYVYQWSSLDLPDDQWMNELSNWFSTSLIALQLFSASYVQSNSPQWSSFSKTPASANEQWMCTNQIVRRDDYTSFSVLGLAIILGVGLLVILLSFTLKPLVNRLQPHTPENEFRTQTWTQLGTLQLQRAVLEKDKPGTWEGESDFPTTREQFSIPLRSPRRQNEGAEEPFLKKTEPKSAEEVMHLVETAPKGSDIDEIWGPIRNTNMAREDRRRSDGGFGWK